jgi:tetratricopeptide (TPR) repeat protein
MSTVLFIPSLIYLFISERTWQTLGIKRLLLMLGFFMCGISFYLYLPIRAAYNPALNWGNPQTWETFLWHVSGKQYRVWMFSSPSVALQQLEYLLVLLLKSFGIVPLLLVPFGLWHLFHRNRRMVWFTLILLATDILYAINYDIQDVDSYFLPVFMVFALWMGGAVLFFSNKALYKRKSFYYLVMCGLCSLFLFPLLLNFNEVNQSKNRLVEQYSRTILQEVKQNALILSFQWDYFCAPCYYLQLVEGLRPDVAIIEVQLLKRSWYITQLQKNYKELMEKSRDEVAAYAQELYKFEHGLPYDPQVIQQRYMEMLNSFIRGNIGVRPVYVTCEIEKEIGAGYVRVPEGLVFRLSEERRYAPFEMADIALPKAGDFRQNDRLHLALRSFYTFMLTSRGLFEADYSNYSQAAVLLQKALELDPHYPLALKGLESISR